jgi:hypothetical protein
VILLTSFRVSATSPNPVPMADSFAIFVRSWPSEKRGRWVDFEIYVKFHREILIGSHSPPLLWSPSPVLKMVSEPVWSPVRFNRLCDLKTIWRNVLLSLWSSMMRISVIGKIEVATIS